MTTIDAIKARCETATPGPWHHESDCGEYVRDEAGLNVCMLYHHCDAAFTSHARGDIPYLLERIAELEGQLTEEISRRYQAECNYDHWKATCEQVRAQLTASQQRERAAVEDLEGAGACFSCEHFRRNGGDCFGAGRCRLDGIEIWPCNEPGVYRAEVPDDGRKTYEWRGPMAGEGER